jgi:hypothetical protein
MHAFGAKLIVARKLPGFDNDLSFAHAIASSLSVVAIGSDAALKDGYTPAAIPDNDSNPSAVHAAFGWMRKKSIATGSPGNDYRITLR